MWSPNLSCQRPRDSCIKCMNICPVCVDSREGGKPEYPQKYPRSIDKTQHTLLGLAFSLARDITNLRHFDFT